MRVITLVIVIFVIGIIKVATMRIEEGFLSDLKRDGTTAQGRITARRVAVVERKPSLSSYYVTYSYDEEGNTYSREGKVSSETYYACKEEDSVTLYYFPEDVKESRLAEEVANNTGCSLGCAILLFIALILFAPGLFIK